MVKDNFIKWDFSLEKPLIVTTHLEAALIFDLRPGLGFHVELCPVPADHNQAFDLFPQLRSDSTARRIMTGIALGFAVR